MSKVLRYNQYNKITFHDLSLNGDASFNNDVFISNNLVTNNDIRCNNRLFILGDVSWNPNNLANDCIPSTAVIGGAGGSSAFSANGDDIYFNNGNVGIGTTTPGSKLDVDGSIRAGYDTNTTSYFGIAAVGKIGYNGFAGISHINCSSGGNYALIQSNEGQTLLNASSGKYIHFRISNYTHMALDSTGNVGIGTTSPSHRLHVTGGVGTRLGSLLLDNNTGSYTTLYIDSTTNSGSGGYTRLYLRNESNENKVTIYANASNFCDDRLKTDEEFVTGATDILMKLSVQKYKKYENFDLSGSFQEETGLVAQDIWYNAPELRHIIDLGVDASGNKAQPLPLPEGVNTLQDIQDDPDYNALGWGDEQAGVLYAQLIPYLIKSNQEQQEKIDALESRLSALENN